MDVLGGNHHYPGIEVVPAKADYPAQELEILAYWELDDTFRASVARRSGKEEYVFYDGPPFANGLPHYGHLLTGFVKDAMPRYQTMRGKRVQRNFGWDCHGLPAEIGAERELGVSGRERITEYGIGRFTEYCKTSVLRYTKVWETYVTRQGRWVDFENGYKTMDLTFMESVIWAFKSLHDKGLIYEGFRVLPYCWECETPLSNSETRQDDAYRDRVDPAVTVAFELALDNVSPFPNLKALVWTTTPWTLPSNLALGVGPELSYLVVQKSDDNYLIGADRFDAYSDILEGGEIVATILGRELLGRRYSPLFPYFADQANAFHVIGADFVSSDEGTGIIHMAPGFGEEDQRVCEEAGIAVVVPVDERGRFTSLVPDYEGRQVFDANEAIIDALRERGAVVRTELYTHAYPHCWRTDTPLIYRAMTSFFVAVTEVKDRMVLLNQEINFYPPHVRDGAFGKWLDGARDWSISRNRFWGAPIPVWKSDDPNYPRVDVYGSLDEIERDFGRRPTDLHRPAIDEFVRPNPDDPTGRSTMRRVTDVLDCWFESGSMPFAEQHYPMENTARFEDNFPADFICEYVGQTRAWFYTLHVLSTALFDRPAFLHCLAHGVVLGDDRRKLSKRLKNFPDPEEFLATFGADSMRWYLLSSAVLRGQDIVIEEKAMSDPIRHVMNPIWNTWHFLCLYAGTDSTVGVERYDPTDPLDRYILQKMRELVVDVTAELDSYDLAGAAEAVTRFVEILTNWYVRRSRERFWRGFGLSEQSDVEKRAAYDTLHTVLLALTKLTAPLLPFLSETIYQGLTGDRSVHLTDWPDVSEMEIDGALVTSMDLVREVCSAGHSIRKEAGRRLRLPLSRLSVAGEKADLLSEFVELIKDELNVKEVVLDTDAGALASFRLNLVPAKLGPRLFDKTQTVIASWRAGDWSELGDGRVQVGGIELEPGEFDLVRIPVDAASSRVLEDGIVLSLELSTTPELEAEGTARDVVRFIQQARRDADLNVSDRITLLIVGDDNLAFELEQFSAEIAAQTLAETITIATWESGPKVETHLLADRRGLHISIGEVIEDLRPS